MPVRGFGVTGHGVSNYFLTGLEKYSVGVKRNETNVVKNFFKITVKNKINKSNNSFPQLSSKFPMETRENLNVQLTGTLFNFLFIFKNKD